MAFHSQSFEGSPVGQPSGEILPVISAIVDEYKRDRTRLLDIVLAVHQRYGCVSDGAMAAIASALGIRTVQVQEMVSFYAFLNKEPKGRFHIRLAKTPVSLMKGAEAVAKAFTRATGAPMEGISPDGRFSLEWTSDTGMGDQEPSALINGSVVTALTPEEVPGIVSALRGDTRDVVFPMLPGPLPNGEVRLGLVQRGAVLFRDGGNPGDGVRKALALTPEATIEAISRSKLRGRGGAGYPTSLKWEACRKAPGDKHYIICNADEGEPGTFKDRVLLTEVPELVFDGMTIGAYAIGASEGILYLRGEYAYMLQRLQQTLERRRAAGLLGKNVCGHEGFDFDIRIQLGAGAYVCGEESSLIESMEGKRGSPRDRPPFPVERGYLGQPTAVDNVETFACCARILEHSPEWFASHGTEESTGTRLLSVSGDCERPGVYEVPFGISMNEVLALVGGVGAAFVQVGGPSGTCLAPADYGRRITASAREDLTTGGSIIVFGPSRDLLDVAHHFMEFFVEESCGWCSPCRIGTTLLKTYLEKIMANRGTKADLDAMVALAGTVTRTSRCGLGQTAARPILSTLQSFPEVYEKRLCKADFMPAVTLEEALAEAVQVQGRQPVAEEI